MTDFRYNQNFHNIFFETVVLNVNGNIIEQGKIFIKLENRPKTHFINHLQVDFIVITTNTSMFLQLY